MSNDKPTDASLLARLDDALLDSIFELSEADLDAEFTEMGLDPAAEFTDRSTRTAMTAPVKWFSQRVFTQGPRTGLSLQSSRAGTPSRSAAGRLPALARRGSGVRAASRG